LGADPENEDDYYTLLGVERDATPDEIKRAYKRQSLQMHPDKLAQKGKVVTEADQARFTHMKEAYEVRCCMRQNDKFTVIFMGWTLTSFLTFSDTFGSS
jgi:curved DNA-binding protein CbpA